MNIDDMNKPLLYLIIALALAFGGVCYMLAEAQMDIVSCFVDPQWTVIEDVSDVFLDPVDGIYATQDWSRWSIYQTNPMAFGYYDTNLDKRELGYWFIMSVTDYAGGGDFVILGDDWRIGSDETLHNPCGVLIVEYVRLWDYEGINSLQSVQQLIDDDEAVRDKPLRGKGRR